MTKEVSTMDTEKNNADLNSNLPKLDRVISKIEPLVKRVNQIHMITSVHNFYRIAVHEPRLLFLFRKDWKAYLMAYKVYLRYKGGNSLSFEQVKVVLEQIKQLDEEFSEEVDKSIPTSKGIGMLAELLQERRKGADYFLSYISTNHDELVGKAKDFPNPNVAKKLAYLLSELSGHEIDYLMKYSSDCEEWANYLVHRIGDINFFVKRINSFLNGGNENKIEYKGLFKDFNDEELKNRIVRTNAAKNLISFQRQVAYLNALINLCKKSETSNAWEGFFGKKGFWGMEEDEKGKNFDRWALQFETVYGNTDFKEMLEQEKNKIAQNPEGWGGIWENGKLVQHGFLTRLMEERLLNPQYQVKHIIYPAASALIRIFEERKSQLMAQKGKKINELSSLLISNAGADNALQMQRVLKKKRKKMIKALKKEISEFEQTRRKPLAECLFFLERLNLATRDMDFEDISNKIISLAEEGRQYDYELAKELVSASFDESYASFIKAQHSEASRAEAKISRWELENLENLSDNDVERLEEMTATGKLILANLLEVYKFISSILMTKYLLDIKQLVSLQIKGRKNKDFKFSYVVKMIKRLR